MTQSELTDLSKLCRERCHKAFCSVAQLTDESEDVYVMAMAMAWTFADLAAELIHHDAEEATGKEIPLRIAKAEVIRTLCANMGFQLERNVAQKPGH